MEDYKSNSFKSREKKNDPIPEKKIKKVVTGVAKIKKKSDIKKFADIFIPEDVANVKFYILWDIIVPAVKDGVEDIVHMLLRGDSSRNRKHTTASKVSYGGFYKDEKREYYKSSRERNNLDYDDIIFNKRGDAEAVLSAMDDIIDQFGVVSIGDLYDLAEITTTNYTINKYGWTDIRGANVVAVRGGYMLKLPRALPLN